MPRASRNSRRSVGRLAFLCFALVLGGALIAVLLVQAGFYLRVRHYATNDPSSTAFMQLRLEQLRERNPAARLEHIWVPYERISPWIKRAVIAAEDARFVDHAGIDWQALRDAFADNAEAGKVVRGGSTITQQLAKNLFLSPKRSYLRKVQEAILAVMIEQAMSKQRILELYLNLIEWGVGVFGAAAAAEHYHGTPVGSINRWQAALLAARIPRPRYYSDRGVTRYLYQRAFDIYGWSNQVRLPR